MSRASLVLFLCVAAIVVSALAARRTLETPLASHSPLHRASRAAPHTPAAWRIVSRAPAAERHNLFIALRHSEQARNTLTSVLDVVSDPTSPKYSQWWTHEAITRLMKPHPVAVATVTSWLAKNGITSWTVQNDWIIANANVEAVEQLLEVDIYRYEHVRSGETIHRAGSLYTVPEEIAEHVELIGNVLHFPKIRPVETQDKRTTFQSLQVTPGVLRDRYSLGNAASQSKNNSQSCVQFLSQYYSNADLDEFFLLFDRGNLGNTPSVVGYDGWGAGTEASLDIQYIMSVGNQVPTTFWSVKDPTDPNEDAFLKWMLQVDKVSKVPLVFSVSYGEDEDELTSQYAYRVNTEFQKQGLRGISVLFASGDSGVGGDSFGCNAFVPDFPCVSPYVTAVGGTTLDGWFETGEEIVNGLSGGGFSNFFDRPAWQVDEVNQYISNMKGQLPSAKKWNATGRAYPDVSALSANYVVVQDFIPMPGVAGTSCAAPVFSGVIAMLNDVRLQNGKKALGYLNPLLYHIARTYPTGFTDITKGSNPGCGTDGFSATKGWDPSSGLGSPVYSELAKIVLQLP
eukprot:TRINITY_DN82_c0_g1_i1.p1 TRINITY_DN82_c0_g1~~TRINITY_DN82_c0_g1_i1.p1  ORF type:complete len:569 (-),score=177.51 TRINITY_DN82_c0_g1_i1:73-1779(-)